MISCARGTRTIPSTQLGTLSLSKGRICSFDARNGRSLSPIPDEITSELGGIINMDARRGKALQATPLRGIR